VPRDRVREHQPHGSVRVSEKEVGPFCYGDNTVLSQKQLADYLQISDRTVRDLGIPRLNLPDKTPRYVVGTVLAYLTGKRGAA
jgi:hypothetical protein